ncbi:MAG: hypothetical protein NZ924_06075 [Candidatus Bipolaricaulota bacterium]|nr:hypothetical protein [Candidatus Bipolaricaulota bacterium]MDW8152454.1 hypothetical protein [Candidatus Bipolaricaulota bacterium]
MSARKWLKQATELAFTQPVVLIPWGVFWLVAFLGAIFTARWGPAAIAPNLVDLFLWLGVNAWASAASLEFLRGLAGGGAPRGREVLRQGLRQTPRLIALYLAILLLLGIALGLPALLLLVARGSLGALILVSLGLFVWFVFLWTRLALAEAAVILGDATLAEALRHSWSLTRAAFLPILGLLFLATLAGAALGLMSLALGPAFTAFSSALWTYTVTVGAGYAYMELRRAQEPPAAPEPTE